MGIEGYDRHVLVSGDTVARRPLWCLTALWRLGAGYERNVMMSGSYNPTGAADPPRLVCPGPANPELNPELYTLNPSLYTQNGNP